MENVKNIGESEISFIDDEGKKQTLKPKEEVECKYKRSMDNRIVILENKKKKGVK